MPRKNNNNAVQNLLQNRKPRTKHRRKRIGDFQVTPNSVITAPVPNLVVRSLTRTIDAGQVYSTSAAAGAYGFPFKFSDITDYASFAATFDQYRFDKIDFEVRAVTLPQAPSSSIGYSHCAFAVDFDSASAPGAFLDVLEYSNVVVLSPGQSYTVSFVPRLLVDTQVSAAAQDAISKSHQWVSTLNPAVVHYGVRLCVKQSTSTNLSAWYVFIRYHISLRSSR